jgi:hypothetical protein
MIEHPVGHSRVDSGAGPGSTPRIIVRRAGHPWTA